MASRGTRNPMKRTGVCRVIARAVASHIAGKASPPRNTSWGAFGPSGFCQEAATCQCDHQSQAANAAARNHGSMPATDVRDKWQPVLLIPCSAAR